MALYKDDMWYRATILAKADSTSYFVCFVDFGHSYKCLTKHLRIAYHFGETPVICFRFILNNVTPR